MSAAKIGRLGLAFMLALAVCVGMAGCSAEKQTIGKLHGVWYEDLTGQPYDFISDTQLVLPAALANGSNAIEYQVVGGDKISMTQSGVIHVIDITKLDSNELDTHDPAADATNKYFRSVDDTKWAQTRATVGDRALAAIKSFASIAPQPDIVWVSAEPTDSADVWTKWPTSSIARYQKAWTWADIAKNPAASLVSSGAAGSEGFAVDFNRVIPSTTQITGYENSTGSKMTAGYSHIAVGYSDTMTQYPAGTFLYMNSQLLYSLGNGFAINVRVGPTKADGFAPGTHN